MRLHLVRPLKSITALPIIDLPDFVVLTGVNGAGKSHLLEAIESGAITVDGISNDTVSRPIRRFDWANLVPSDTGAFAPYQITQEQSNYWNEIRQHSEHYRSSLEQQLLQIGVPRVAILPPSALLRLTEADLLQDGKTHQEAAQILAKINAVIRSHDQQVRQRFAQNDRNKQRLLQQFSGGTSTPIVALEQPEFFERFPRSWQAVDPFQQSFGRLFADYQRNWTRNRLKMMAHDEGEAVDYLSDDRFRAMHGIPPWEFVNSVLEAAKLDFRVNSPPKFDDFPFEPVLTSGVTGANVKFNDLSSGEKVLMSFALCLYYAKDSRQLVDYPKMLLFDEIDAPLHPSMAQSLLTTIQQVLVGQHGIKVILTTHSPSTVALSPADALHTMHKSGTERLQKATKDRALAILTTGVPTLSIEYENRRQVFVESEYDARCYDAIYQLLRGKLIPEISLSFIAAGVGGRGNCDQVRDVVKNLVEGGCRSVFGIVDWDLTNVGDEFIKVVGAGSRYSIENCILDPLLIGALLLREKWITREECGLLATENFVDFSSIGPERLQMVASRVIDKVASVVQPPSEGEYERFQYSGGQNIQVPRWFARLRGHALEQSVKDAFPQLRRYSREPELKLEIIRKVLDDLPDFVPLVFLEVLTSIQDHSRQV